MYRLFFISLGLIFLLSSSGAVENNSEWNSFSNESSNTSSNSVPLPSLNSTSSNTSQASPPIQERGPSFAFTPSFYLALLLGIVILGIVIYLAYALFFRKTHSNAWERIPSRRART